MTENRDFLKEFEELRAETDGIRNSLVSKIGHFHNLLFDSGVLKDIVGELKAIRKENEEIKENQKMNDKKFKELKTEIARLKAQLLQENLENRQQLEEKEMEITILKENDRNTGKNISKFRDKMLEEMEKIQAIPEHPSKKVPIRNAILGEWKMVEHENFEGYNTIDPHYCTFQKFSENVKYELVYGKLQQSGGGLVDLIEGGYKYGEKDLFVEDNHLKTFWGRYSTMDRYIKNGKLHVIRYFNGTAWKCIYEKI